MISTEIFMPRQRQTVFVKVNLDMMHVHTVIELQMEKLKIKNLYEKKRLSILAM